MTLYVRSQENEIGKHFKNTNSWEFKKAQEVSSLHSEILYKHLEHAEYNLKCAFMNVFFISSMSVISWLFCIYFLFVCNRFLVA